jgi:hypothetical protein
MIVHKSCGRMGLTRTSNLSFRRFKKALCNYSRIVSRHRRRRRRRTRLRRIKQEICGLRVHSASRLEPPHPAGKNIERNPNRCGDSFRRHASHVCYCSQLLKIWLPHFLLHLSLRPGRRTDCPGTGTALGGSLWPPGQAPGAIGASETAALRLPICTP